MYLALSCVAGGLLPTTVLAQQDSTTGISTAAESQQTDTTPAVTSGQPSRLAKLTLGMDAAAWSLPPEANANRVTTMTLPEQYVWLGMQFTDRFRLQIPFSLSMERSGGFVSGTSMSGIFGAFGTVFLGQHAWAVQPFLGVGGLCGWTIADHDHTARYALDGDAGIEMPITGQMRFRSTLLYQYTLADQHRSAPAVHALGAQLGLVWNPFAQTPPSDSHASMLRMGMAYQYIAYGQITGVNLPSVREINLPSPSVGVMVPVALGGQFAVGAMVRGHYASITSYDILIPANTPSGYEFLRIVDSKSSYALTVQPRMEWNVESNYRTKPGLRLGTQVDIERATDGGKLETTDGVGGDAVATLPIGQGGHRVYAGLGYDHWFGKRSSTSVVPAMNITSVKLGLDSNF